MTTKRPTGSTALRVDRSRADLLYGQGGDPLSVRLDDVMAVVLNLPSRYAEQMLESIAVARRASPDFEDAQISVDLPVSLFLSRPQLDLLAVALAKLLETSR